MIYQVCKFSSQHLISIRKNPTFFFNCPLFSVTGFPVSFLEFCDSGFKVHSRS